MTVRTEIETKLNTWAKAQVPPVPVAFENVPFTKPTTGPFLEIFFLAAVTVNPDVAAEKERETGIFQINVCIPQNKGVKERETLVAALKELFPVLPKAPPVSIERPPSVSSGRNRTDGFHMTPVSFSYRTFSA